MDRTNQKFFVWWRDTGVSLCDHKSMMFFNKHALFSKRIWFVEFYVGQTLPKGVDLCLP